MNEKEQAASQTAFVPKQLHSREIGRNLRRNAGEISDIYWSPPKMLEECVPQAERARHGGAFLVIGSLHHASY